MQLEIKPYFYLTEEECKDGIKELDEALDILQSIDIAKLNIEYPRTDNILWDKNFVRETILEIIHLRLMINHRIHKKL